MADLSRDELRRACEAVGWEWEDSVNLSGAMPGSAAVDSESRDRFASWADTDWWDADALALLEATGEDFEVACHHTKTCTKWTAGIIRTGYQHIEPTLPAAAVRAVNAWAEKKEEAGNG